MNVLIPVAGQGIRLKPHTYILPKSLLYVAGKPILGHILDSLINIKIEKLVIVLGAKGEAIVQFCRKYSFNFKFVTQEHRLGLGHAIYLGAQSLVGETLILLGDTIIDFEFKKLFKKDINILAVKEVAKPERFGIVEVKNGKIIDIIEKPARPSSNLAVVGLYYFQQIEKVREAIACIIKKGIRTKGEYQLTDALRILLQKGERFGFIKVARWYDCGTPEALIETNRHLLKKNHHYKVRKEITVIKPVFIADSAQISNSIIGPNVSVGEKAVIKNSIIKDSIINHGATIEDELLCASIIGENALVQGSFKKLNVGDSSAIEYS